MKTSITIIFSIGVVLALVNFGLATVAGNTHAALGWSTAAIFGIGCVVFSTKITYD